MRTVAIIQARLGSQRLPGKMLADLSGRPLIAHVVERVRACPGLDQVVVAIPRTPENEPLAEVLIGLKVYVFCGAEHDVLDRYVQCARQYEADVVLRVTGDCPLWDPTRGAAVLAERHRRTLALMRDLNWPGLDAEVFIRAALEWAEAHATEREHMGLAVAGVVESFPDWWAAEYPPRPDAPWLAVDTAEDLARVRAVYAALEDPTDFSLAATLAAWEAAGRP